MNNITSIKNIKVSINKFKFERNYPNQFNPSTKIKYQIPKQGMVTLRVFDISGKEIKTLVNQYMLTGIYNIKFNASGLSSGVDLYQLKSNDFVFVRKMILIK